VTQSFLPSAEGRPIFQCVSGILSPACVGRCSQFRRSGRHERTAAVRPERPVTLLGGVSMSLRASFVGPVLALAFLVGAAGDECPVGGPFPAARAGKEKAGKLKFEVTRDAAKEFRWRLKAANGKILATSGQGYKAKADCMNGIKRIQKDVDSGKLKFELYKDKAMEFRWRLKAANGQIIGASSDGYKAERDADHAIELIKKGAARATVEDLS
jgi:uncharacterized protein YegP (UPF0339 family)